MKRLVLCVLLAAANLSPAAHAEVALAIPPQPLISALDAFAARTGLQVIYRSDVVAAVQSKGAASGLSPEITLGQLLRDTGLRFEFINERTVAIRAEQSTATQSATPQTRDPSDTSALRLAQAEQGPSSAASASSTSPEVPAQLSRSSIVELAEIVVTGSHIRGGQSAGARVVTIDREEIDRSGYGRVQDLLETLPQNFTGISEDFDQSFVSNLNKGSEIQLRGLGPGTTLTLINGQRLPSGGTLGAFVDISNIPSSAIERVEILPDGASAIYGSDAIGGVVNFIMRKDYEGAETRVRYGSADGAANEVQIAQLLGSSWSGGHALFGYQYSDREALKYGDSEYFETDGDLRVFGGSDWRRSGSNMMRGGVPGNILDAAGQPAFAIPSGQDGTNLTAADLLPGVVNYQDLSDADILSAQRMHSAFLTGSLAVSDGIELSGDFRYSRRDSQYIIPGNGAVVTVPSTNPFYVNPTGGTGPVRVEYDFARDLGPITSNAQTETGTAVLGATIDLAGAWSLSLSGSYGREVTRWFVTNRMDSTARTAALNDTNPATALNVFGDGSANNPATLDAIRLTQFERGTSAVWSAGAIADGALFELPGGTAKLAIGINYRDERLDVRSDFNIDGTTHSARAVGAAFTELSLPLVGEERGIPGVSRLELSLAGRYDEYDDFGGTFNPKAGLNWRVVDSFKLRGSWGTSFRAPPFYLSNTDIREGAALVRSLADPASPTRSTTVFNIVGVVPDLTEETAKVWSAGLDFTPTNDFSLSVAYFNIRYKDRIQGVGAINTLLAREADFAGTDVIVRNPTPAQLAAACDRPEFTGTCPATVGAIVDTRLRNLSVVNVDGIDIDVDYSFDTDRLGTFTAGLAGTYTLSNKQAVTEISPLVDVIDTLGNPLSRKARARLGWNRVQWNAGATVSYAGGYDMPGSTAGIDSWTTLDLSMGYAFPDGPDVVSGLRLQFAAINVLDKLPPFVDQFGGYDTANASVIGRTFSLQAIKGW